jgi:glycerophosphoryl diester phosphodiesterase
MRNAVVVAALLVAVGGACAEPPALKPYLTRFHRPLHICHQGGEDVFPTNTLYAYRHCVAEFDTDVLEIDVHQTKDGHLVVLHDETVDRTTNGTGLVKEMTLAELQALDAAAKFTPEDGEGTPLAGQGIFVPTLEEVLDEFPDHLTNIEIKQTDPPIEQALVDMVVAHGMTTRVCLGSFHDGVAAKLRELLPAACHYAPEDMARDYYIGTRARITGFFPPPVDAFALPPFSGDTEVIDERLVEAAHLERKHVWAWTIDDVDEMNRLFDLGVDGIMTNRPDRLRDVMIERGILSD